jgi:hypothetical protein
MGGKTNARQHAIHTSHTHQLLLLTPLSACVSQSSFAFLFLGKHTILAGSSFECRNVYIHHGSISLLLLV